MARFTPPHDSAPIIDAARSWVDHCLIDDGSVLGEEAISSAKNFDALDRYFVKRPAPGDASFYEKLETQLVDAPPAARKLMAELMWALFLFPSNIGTDTKREGVMRVWALSGEELDPKHPLLSDEVFDGIGSAGMGVNTNRWREVHYLVGLGQAIKSVPKSSRGELFDDYGRYMDWIQTVPQEGDRQFRHMLRFFLFPDRVERMSSNRDRLRVLDAFGVEKPKVTRKWTDRQLDEALLDLRGKLEEQYEIKDLDFYRPPLREVWQAPNEPSGADDEDAEASSGKDIGEPDATYTKPVTTARNLIYYGPPGTGKTFRLKEEFDNYTDQPADIDRTTWQSQLVARYGWRAVIAAALADMGKPAKANELEEHPLVRAKAAQRKRTSAIRSTLWGYLQEHAMPTSVTVNVSVRRPPYIFDKREDSSWILMPDWREQDGEAVQLLETWTAGPGVEKAPIKRYRVVTFHPSYAYEDFVIGLRPVILGEEGDGTTGFQMVDGGFKQICEEARSNPGKRYALCLSTANNTRHSL